MRKVVIKSGKTEQRFYVGDYELFIKEDTERETLHINDDKSKVALIDFDKINSTTTIRYQLTNHLDSASLELDENANIISYEEYHPFGTTSYRSGRNLAEVSLKRYKYVFKELDNETGLYYYGMRYYASWIARFISVDPLQFEYPYYTPFQYAGNKPISYIDLDGAEERHTIYNPYITEKWQTKFDTSKVNDVKELLKGTRELSQIFFGDDKQVEKMYPNIPFQWNHYADINRIFVATSSVGELGKFEESGGLLIEGYNREGELVELYKSKNYNRSMELLNKKRQHEIDISYSALNNYDRLDGEYGFHHGGKQLLLGTIGFWFGVSEIAAGATGIWLLISSLSIANEVDNMMGVVIYEGGDSFTVNMSDDKEVKLFIQGFKTFIDVVDVGTDVTDIFTNKEVIEKIFNTAAAADDGTSIYLDIETLKSISNN